MDIEIRKKEMPADRLLIELTSPQLHAVTQMVALGYGDGTPASAVEYALSRVIDDLKRARLIAPPAASDED